MAGSPKTHKVFVGSFKRNIQKPSKTFPKPAGFQRKLENLSKTFKPAGGLKAYFPRVAASPAGALRSAHSSLEAFLANRWSHLRRKNVFFSFLKDQLLSWPEMEKPLVSLPYKSFCFFKLLLLPCWPASCDFILLLVEGASMLLAIVELGRSCRRVWILLCFHDPCRMQETDLPWFLGAVWDTSCTRMSQTTIAWP